MAALDTISFLYYGGDADHNQINFYDASVSYEGAARTLAIIGHYYLKQDIIIKAPNSAMPLFLTPPEEGSFKQTIVAGVVTGLIVTGISVPFTIFTTRLINNWIPQASSPEQLRIIQLLEEQNALLRRQQGLPQKSSDKEKAQEQAADKFIKEHEKDLQVVRSVTSQSFKKIYRPIATNSVKHMGIIGGGGSPSRSVVDSVILERIQADELDDKDVIVMGVVSSFSRGSKTGVVFSNDYIAGFRIEYAVGGKLPREDDFSWSQYSGKPIKMRGRFVRFFDGKVKKLLVYNVERVTHQPDIDDYFKNDREVRTLNSPMPYLLNTKNTSAP